MQAGGIQTSARKPGGQSSDCCLWPLFCGAECSKQAHRGWPECFLDLFPRPVRVYSVAHETTGDLSRLSAVSYLQSKLSPEGGAPGGRKPGNPIRHLAALYSTRSFCASSVGDATELDGSVLLRL